MSIKQSPNRAYYWTKICAKSRAVTKIQIRQRLNFGTTDLKFDKCFKRFVVECKFVEKYLFYD